MTAAVDAAGGAGGLFDAPRSDAALTAGLEGDPSVLTGEDVEAGLLAAFRADNHAAWLRCRWLFEACRSRAGTTTRVANSSRAALIAAAALGWTGAMAAARLEFARQVLVRLPALGEAMREGWLEESKASTIVSIVRELDDAQARVVVERLLGRARELTHPELARKAEKAAADVDPAWHEARRAAAVARARVVARSAPSGAAELSGLDLPEDLALEGHSHVVAVADAVRAAVRARGGDVGHAFTEAHVYLRLLGPSLIGADDATIVATLTEELLHRGDGDEGPDGDGGPDDGRPDDVGPDGPEGDEPDDACPDAEDDAPDASRAERAFPGEPTGTPLAFRAAVAVRLELTTLLRLDRGPGEVPDFGVVCSSTARHLARTRTGAAVRLLLYDPHGNLEYVLTPRLPSGGASRRRSRYRRQVIELTALTATLDALDPNDHLGLDATLITRARAALQAARARPTGEHPAISTADARRRRPGAELDAWIRSRDRTCRFPGCCRPAMRADLDHTLDWLYGGPTEACNLGAFCEAHHLLKHDPASGWSVVQPSPGTFIWTSPTGTRHRVGPGLYDGLPDPTPPADGPCSIPDAVFSPPPRVVPAWAPRPTRRGHLTDAARATAACLTRLAASDAAPSQYDDDPDF
jgi:hypothetical protein